MGQGICFPIKAARTDPAFRRARKWENNADKGHRERAWRSARGRRYEPDLHAASYIWRVAARVSRRPLSRREFSRFRNTRHGGAFLKASHRHTRMVGALSACFAVARD